jgi:ferritin-like metal-binding protein YciE/gas vesicle protein
MQLETLRNLYISQLQEMYSTEKQIADSLPKMASAASNTKLKAGLEKHLVQTKTQIKRLEQVLSSLGVNPENETSKPMIGLAAEGKEIMASGGDPHVMDAAIIAANQKIEHYEIASYGTILAYAKLLGDHQSIKLLKLSLEEERMTDKQLTLLAEGLVNPKAVRASGFSDSKYSYDNGGLSFSAILLGAAAGVAAGILLAPSTGQDTRKKIIDTATSLWDQFGGQAGNLADLARNKVKQVVGDTSDTSTSAGTSYNADTNTNLGGQPSSF